MIGELEKQTVSDRRLAATEIGAPERLPVEKRTAYYLARLEDVQTSLQELDDNPGRWAQVESLGGLIKIGRPAVPGLIAHLADRGLTRITDLACKEGFGYRALRVQDVSLYAIEKIVETQFYAPSDKSRCLSDKSESERAKVIAEVKKWWEQYGDKPPPGPRVGSNGRNGRHAIEESREDSDRQIAVMRRAIDEMKPSM